MPFFFILIGFGLVVIGYRGTQEQFFQLLKEDFSGSGNFFVFALGIFVVGLIGYVPKLKGLSDAFIGLILVVMLLSNRGFFSQFMQQVQGTQTDGAGDTNGFTTGQIPGIPPVPGFNG